MPAGKAAGLPAGVQVMAERFQDLACLEAAEAIEAALGAAEPIDPVLETVPSQRSRSPDGVCPLTSPGRP